MNDPRLTAILAMDAETREKLGFPLDDQEAIAFWEVWSPSIEHQLDMSAAESRAISDNAWRAARAVRVNSERDVTHDS